jgi:hypothetical protein
MESFDDFEWEDGWHRPADFDVSDVTYYRGYPVPIALLEHVYDISGHDMERDGTGRDLSLVEDTWDLLRGWWEEVELQKEARGSDETLEHLTAPDRHAMEFGTCTIGGEVLDPDA